MLNKNKFSMKNIILLFVTISFLSTTNGVAQKRFSKLLKDHPAMVSYTFRTEFAKDMAKTLDNTKALGITNIEFSNLFGKKASEIRSMLDTRGMICTSYGTSYDALLNKMDTVIQDVHVKDLKKGVKGDFTGGTATENDVTLGTGQLNLPEILKAAKKTKIKYFYIEDENAKSNEQVPLSIAYLKTL